ncbi:MAG: hypothetical protein HUJ26_16095 [Planctomycetaceae bacterium]|nr:hypothetical protein [Planctomycetaceae bacterium]
MKSILSSTTFTFFSSCLLLFSCLAMNRVAQAEVTDLNNSFPMSGSVNDVRHGFASSGYQFDVRFTKVQYAGQVEQTLLQQEETEPDKVWFGMRDMDLTIGQTSITGRRHSASVGPFKIQLGQADVVWMSVEVDQSEDDEGANSPQFTLGTVEFKLPPGDWAVRSPSWVRTRGFGMTESKVVTGLRSGLQRNPRAIEEQFMKQVPDLFAKVEGDVRKALTQINDQDASEHQLAVADQTMENATSTLAAVPLIMSEGAVGSLMSLTTTAILQQDQSEPKNEEQLEAPEIPETPYRRAYQVTLLNKMDQPLLLKMVHVQPEIGCYRYYLEPGDHVTRYFEGGRRVLVGWDRDKQLLFSSPLSVDGSGTVVISPETLRKSDATTAENDAADGLQIDTSRKPKRPRQSRRGEQYGEF